MHVFFAFRKKRRVVHQKLTWNSPTAVTILPWVINVSNSGSVGRMGILWRIVPTFMERI